ncbi:hypothetical protein MN032_11045 [Agromyces atrinae]|uniref:hypothetical protein n=1 Tax=Agromyces atrinae TaxID=592376 RepID=UPI001F56426A|nr:hypothetical protein [Agromyces atrinae]MCI2958234.1 hypothetical protein [Agromyces atrinae]
MNARLNIAMGIAGVIALSVTLIAATPADDAGAPAGAVAVVDVVETAAPEVAPVEAVAPVAPVEVPPVVEPAPVEIAPAPVAAPIGAAESDPWDGGPMVWTDDEVEAVFEDGYNAGIALAVHAFSTPCETEDSDNCYWDARVFGNELGESFVTIRGESYYFWR